MKPYLAFGKMAFKNQLAYSVANWAGLFTNIFFLFFRAGLYESCMTEGVSVGGMDRAGALTYIVVTQALVMVIPQWGAMGLSESIMDGRIATEICRPSDYFLLHMSRRLGISLYYLFLRCLPLACVGCLADLLVFPPAPQMLPVFLLSVLFGTWIANCVWFLVECSAFWMENATGTRYLLLGPFSVMSGLVLPINFLPAWAKTINDCLPITHTLNTPTQIYLGAWKAETLTANLAIQFFWVLVLSLACKALLQAGTRKLVIHGG